ncbi:MAG: glycosyltransferase family 4 protein [bacterium]|nr:glycosyltransferase family 4 protein [bacterium]
MRIDQLLPGIAIGDAISNHARQLQAIARGWGADSTIYCDLRHVHPEAEHLCADYRRLPPRGPADVTVYHYSVGSALTPVFRGLAGRRVLVYHNITPHEFYEGIHDGKAAALRAGREELASLAGVPDLALGVSEFNRRELEARGFRRTGVLPLILDEEKLAGEPDRAVLRRYRGGANLLFVGRMAPNKRVEDLIRIFYCFRNTVNPRSRLILAGSLMGMDRYMSSLRALVTVLDLPDVVFLNHVTDAALHALYRTAGAFVCMSEHEGFCIPLLEAMHFRVPVIAYAAAAVPETLAGAGVLVREKDHAAIAELAGMVISDASLRRAVVERQLARLPDFSLPRVAARFRGQLAPLLAAG